MQPFNPINHPRLPNNRPPIDPTTESVTKKFKKNEEESIEKKVDQAGQGSGFIDLNLDPHDKFQQLSSKYEKLSKKIAKLQDTSNTEFSDAKREERINKKSSKLQKIYEERMALGREMGIIVPEMEIEAPAKEKIEGAEAKEQFIKHIKTLKTIEDFRKLLLSGRELSPEDQKILEQAFFDRALNPIKLGFTAMTEDGSVHQDLTFPLSVWKAHSDYFGKLLTTSMQKMPCQDVMSFAAHRAFMAALCNYSGSGLISIDNLQELWTVADKYQISWLAADCAKYFEEVYKPLKKFEAEIENLKIAAQFRQPIPVSSSIVSLCKIYQDLKETTKLSQQSISSLLNQLNELADEFKLADLKFFVTCGLIKIRPDHSFGGGVYSLEALMNPLFKDPLKQCFAMQNSTHFPKMVLALQTFGPNAVPVLNEILEHANVPITLNITSPMPVNLNEILQQIPKVKDLRIVFDCFRDDPISILEMIAKNTTLSSLHLTLMNYDNRNTQDEFITNWPGTPQNIDVWEQYDGQYLEGYVAAQDDIEEALIANDKLRKETSVQRLQVKVVQSNISLDDDSLYSEKQSVILHNDRDKNTALSPYVRTFTGRENRDDDEDTD